MEKNGEIVVSKKQLIKNIEEIKKIARNKKICAMVKANAYGHGLENVVEKLRNSVDFFGVANINEALKIREICPNAKILIVGKTRFFKDCWENNLSFVIESFSQFENLMLQVKNNENYDCINIHIKINSGMNRLGISSVKEFKKIFEECEKNNINVEGVLTHFSTADCDENFFEKQKIVFKRFLKEIPKREQPIIHIGGSAAAISKMDFDFDMVRIGIGLYGYLKGANVKPVMQVKSNLIKVFDVEAGDRIGYSNGFIAKQNMKIGIVPLGYGDGISRNLSNKAEVEINKTKCKIVGHICMDMFFVDVSRAQAKEGDEVVVFKDAKKWAQILGTTSYEVLTHFSLIR